MLTLLWIRAELNGFCAVVAAASKWLGDGVLVGPALADGVKLPL